MTDTTLTISWPDGDLTVEAGTEVVIGREAGATIVLASSAVSRRHARISYDGGVWTFRDENSTQGSFSGGSAVQTLNVTGPVDLLLGQGPEAVMLSLTPSTALTSPVPAEATRAATGRVSVEQAPAAAATAAAAQRPGGALSADAISAATVVPATNDERAVVLSTDSATLALHPGETATLGRDDENELVVADPTVSRRHLRVEHDGDSWSLVDLGSAAGTWLADARVSRTTLVGEQTFVLGDRHGSTTLRTRVGEPATQTADSASATADVAATGNPAPSSASRKVVAIIAAVAVLIAAVGAGAWWLTHRTVSTNTLAQGTVLITTTGWGGSGTIIDAKKGLILTNAHVAAPQAMGTGVRDGYFPDELRLADSSRTFTIAISSGLDKSAEPRFIAELVTADGYLDLAILRITKTVAGATVSDADLDGLVEIPIGDSSSVGSGDPVTVIGYPSAARSIAPTLTQGVISGVQGDPRLNINNAWLNIDATTAPGNSGGLGADASGRLVGVPSRGLLNPKTREAVLYAMRPVALAQPLIEAARNGTTYTSPWTQDAPAGASISAVAPVAPVDAAVSAKCVAADPATQPNGVYAYGFDYTGFPSDTKNTDVLGVVYDAKGIPVMLARAAYPTALPVSGCATLTFATSDGAALPDGEYRLVIGLGGNYKVVDAAKFTIGAAASPNDPNGTGTAPPLG